MADSFTVTPPLLLRKDQDLDNDRVSEQLPPKPLSRDSAFYRNGQVGGSHYVSMEITPAEYAERNKLSFLEGNVVKYVSRHGSKNGADDLKKAINCLEIILDHVYGERQ